MHVNDLSYGLEARSFPLHILSQGPCHNPEKCSNVLDNVGSLEKLNGRGLTTGKGVKGLWVSLLGGFSRLKR